MSPKQTANGAELDAIMIKKGLTSAELSLKTAYADNVIRQWRRGHKPLSNRTMRYIRLVLGLPNPPLKAKKAEKAPA